MTRRMALAALAVCLLAPMAGAQDAKHKAAVRKLLLPEAQKDLDALEPAVMEMIAGIADATISEITIDMAGADEAKGRVTKRGSLGSESTGMAIKRVDGAWRVSL
jgi:hypothetical protein